MHAVRSLSQHIAAKASHIWNRITTPGPNIVDPKQRQRTQLLASMFLVIAFVLAMAIVVRIAIISTASAYEAPLSLTMLAVIGVMLISHQICIKGRPNLAVMFSLYTVEGIIVALVIRIGLDGLWIFSYQLVLLILAGLFAQATNALRLFIFQLVITILVGAAIAGELGTWAVIGPLNFIMIAGTSILTALVYANVMHTQNLASVQRSEQKTLAAIESSLDPFFLLSAVRDVQGNLIDYRIDGGNAAAAAMVGRDTASLIGQHVMAAFPNAVDLGLVQRYNHVLETGERLEEEYYLPQLDMWRHVQIVKVGDGLALTSREITERKRTEIKLLEQEAILRQITENVDDIFYIVDARTSKMLYVSPNFHTLCRVPPESMHGQDMGYLEALHPEDAPAFLDAIKKQREMGVLLNIESRIIDKVGQVHWMWLRNFPAYDEQGQLVRYIGIAKDMTARREAEQQRISLGLERERLEVMRGFVSDISHDLMTPLTVIRTSLYLLNKQDDPIARAERSHRIEQQVDRLHQMISDMLILTRLERPIHDEFRFEPQNLNAFLTHIIDDFQSIAREKGVTLTLETAAMPEVMLDTNKFQRAISNILNNAVKFTPAGGVVHIRTGQEHHYGIIHIEDTGTGIPPQDLPRIFDRFYRVDKSRSDGGSGLGLAITQKIVQAHQGSITAESQLGQGTRFVLKLPLPEPQQSILV